MNAQLTTIYTSYIIIHAVLVAAYLRKREHNIVIYTENPLRVMYIIFLCPVGGGASSIIIYIIIETCGRGFESESLAGETKLQCILLSSTAVNNVAHQ